MSNSLVGIFLVSETNTVLRHPLGVIHLPLTDRGQTLPDFRPILEAAFPSIFSMKSFVFLTSHGWDINEMMEYKVRLSDVISEESAIRVRITYHKPKYGITIEGQSDTSVGFLFCDSEINITQLKEEIQTQLPLLHRFLSTVHFAFLDLNGWPINSQQENLLCLLEIAPSHMVSIRCAKSLISSQQPIISSGSSVPSTSIISGTQLDPTSTLLQPITEFMECVETSNVNHSISSLNFDSLHRSAMNSSFEILISYVHSEAEDYATPLKASLEKLGYSVFLDIHCIQGGTDWQDVLNDAITNCSLFVPLITLQYGQTLWTNREVKLADVLGKIIIPVNFLNSWPPQCLAIQFATTQFVQGCKGLSGIPDNIDEEIVSAVASDISSRFSREQSTTQSVVAVEDDNIPTTVQSLSQDDTLPIYEETSSTGSTASLGLHSSTSPIVLRKKSTIRSYASNLPASVDASYRQTITKSREGKPLIVVSCALEQQEFAHQLFTDEKMDKYEIWYSCDIKSSENEENARLIFQQKADEAGVVVVILSEDFASSAFCKQQVYYCEQRKRIIPLIYKPMQLPTWMAVLIGTSTFIDCQSQNFKMTLSDHVESSFDPHHAEMELKLVLKQKVELANMCTKLSERIPKGKHVYISGGTQFYSKCGKAICEELGKKLAQDREIVLITGGFYGVGETVAKSFYDERIRLNKPHGVCHVVAIRDKQDKSNQTRQNSDGTFVKVPYGDTLFFGDSVRQREMLTPKVIEVCILVEGGPGAAFEAQQFTWNGNRVIPVKVTGGAASGLFNIPPSVLAKPPNVTESDWASLGDPSATSSDIAAALFQIVQTVSCNPTSSSRSRSSSINESMKFKRVSIRRSDTMPVELTEGKHEKTISLESMKRTFSEKEPGIKKQKALVL